MGGMVASQTKCCMMTRDEYDEDDVSDSERAEEGAKETKVQALGAQRWSGSGRPGSPSPSVGGTAPCPVAAVPRSLSDATIIVPNQRRI